MILFLDCANGISGDMLVAALLELCEVAGGDPLEELVRPALAAVGVDPQLVSMGRVTRGGLCARALTVVDAPGFDTFADLIAAVEAAPLPAAVAEAAVAAARLMAAAEARVHGDHDEHLHELAGIDTVIDLVSAAVLIDHLAPDAIVASPPALGSGLVTTAHGVVPVPAPAVLALLAGRPTAGTAAADETLGELTTPTGAALLVQYARSFSGIPRGRLERTGYGAGQRDIPGRPNVLRALLLAPEDETGGGLVSADHVVIETNIDDMTPELLAHAADVLRDAGALDVWLTAALMKKGRPGHVLHVLAAAGDRDRLAGLVFTETSSFGVRVQPILRLYADQQWVSVNIEGCDVEVRLGYVAGRLVTVSPEYEDVRRAAAASGRPAKAIHEAAQAAARSSSEGSG